MYAHSHKYIDTSAPSDTHVCEWGTLHTHKCLCASVSSTFPGTEPHIRAQSQIPRCIPMYSHTHAMAHTRIRYSHRHVRAQRPHTNSHAHSCTCLHPGTHMKSFTVIHTQVSILIFMYRCSTLLAFNPQPHGCLSSVQNLEKVLGSFASLFTCM